MNSGINATMFWCEYSPVPVGAEVPKVTPFESTISTWNARFCQNRSFDICGRPTRMQRPFLSEAGVSFASP